MTTAPAPHGAGPELEQPHGAGPELEQPHGVGAELEPSDSPEDPADRAPQGRIAMLAGHARRALVRARARIAFWSRSLLARVIVLTLTLSTIVMVILGLILQQQITTGLLRSKIDAATAGIDSARQTVQSSLSGADSDPSSLREQLRLALTEIGRADGSADAQGSTAGVFEPVIVPSRIGSEADLAITQTLSMRSSSGAVRTIDTKHRLSTSTLIPIRD